MWFVQCIKPLWHGHKVSVTLAIINLTQKSVQHICKTVQRWWRAKKKEIMCSTLRGMEKDSRKLEKGGKMRIEWYDSWWCRPGTLCSALKMIILSRWEAIAAVCHLQTKHDLDHLKDFTPGCSEDVRHHQSVRFRVILSKKL